MVNVNNVDDVYMDEETYERVAFDYILICYRAVSKKKGIVFFQDKIF